MTISTMLKNHWTLIAAAFAIGGAWVSINRDIAEIDHKVTALQARSANELCLAIMTRRIVAVEQGRADVRDQLKALSHEQGCIQDYTVMAASVPLTGDALVTALAEARKRELETEQVLAAIDAKLAE